LNPTSSYEYLPCNWQKDGRVKAELKHRCMFVNMGSDLTPDQITVMINKRIDHSLSPDVIPNGITCCPMIWNYLGTKHKMTIFSGFIGNEITKFGVHAKMGWALVHDENEYTLTKTPWSQIY
jgi:hypothetical protein